MFVLCFTLTFQIISLQVDTTILGLDAERAKEMPYIASMGIYVVSKEAMISLLRTHFPEANDFGSEVIPGATKLGMKVFSTFTVDSSVNILHIIWRSFFLELWHRCPDIASLDYGGVVSHIPDP